MRSKCLQWSLRGCIALGAGELIQTKQRVRPRFDYTNTEFVALLQYPMILQRQQSSEFHVVEGSVHLMVVGVLHGCVAAGADELVQTMQRVRPRFGDKQ